MKSSSKLKTSLAAATLIAINFAMAGTASAHCDGMDGPVINEARAALEKRDVTPLLKWVPQSGELAIKEAFARTLSERTANKTVREAADRRFFGKLVQIHRESEGAPFTGIKPAGQIEPIVAEADAALDNKDVDHLAKHVASQVEKAIRDKFEAAVHSRENADRSIGQGREFVGNYVQYVHFVEELSNMAGTPAGHHAPAQAPSGHKH